MPADIASKLAARDAGFRWRSATNVTRVEGFSDGVFGFAITLLVLSQQVPRTSTELLRLVEGLPAFAAAFAVIVLIWHSHSLFFRRYGLQDGATLVLNAVLLLLVCFLVYPLKFLFTLLADLALGLNRGAVSTGPEHGVALFAVYSLALVAVFLLLTVLYVRAWCLREPLQLSPLERYLTVTSIQHHAIYCGVGLLAVSLVAVGGLALLPWAAGSFCLLGPLCGLHGWWRGCHRPPPEAPADFTEDHSSLPPS